MNSTTSKLTRKYQATIPGPVRELLELDAGDVISFDIEGDNVQLRKVRPVDLAFIKAIESTFEEWGSKTDEEAYRDL